MRKLMCSGTVCFYIINVRRNTYIINLSVIETVAKRKTIVNLYISSIDTAHYACCIRMYRDVYGFD